MEQRREFLKKLGILGLSTGIGSIVSARSNSVSTQKKTSLRIAHITDIHIKNKKAPIEHFKHVLSDINSSSVDFIINTGDSVFNMNKENESVITEHWNAWHECIAFNKLPMYSCIGNHDVWTEGNGKIFTINQLNLPNRFYSFHRNGWKFIMLDSIQQNKHGYELDDEQWSWLSEELNACEKDEHVVICSHVPIMSLASLMYAANKKGFRGLKNLGNDMHTDAMKIKDHFRTCPNIKLALSGHVHYVDAVDYLGVKYVCGGAVCGNWWKGVLDDFPPAYGIIELFDDGTVENKIIYYA
jgi:Icc protein